uniref:USP domain-containing protein n=1 Tax=Chromera velia CCMP2878 TaxID=1169474 RepID=A0A0G4G1R1_9ALVE|eukprot:Cvel_19851.t1-p1 / transcript=Cvel_19851.t1 / gene=Cvel_19851 / organism=Chromera_velia_CCMP2878 / gene_product=hypothetical protein / transcript_product=hypothetical protein / location=Cvel_scaffold1738:22180-30591(+) / protein_length=935 / sequence_SO=supercontig / SO=protein_coding / is_pseudo=false
MAWALDQVRDAEIRETSVDLPPVSITNEPTVTDEQRARDRVEDLLCGLMNRVAHRRFQTATLPAFPPPPPPPAPQAPQDEQEGEGDREGEEEDTDGESEPPLLPEVLAQRHLTENRNDVNDQQITESQWPSSPVRQSFLQGALTPGGQGPQFFSSFLPAHTMPFDTHFQTLYPGAPADGLGLLPSYPQEGPIDNGPLDFLPEPTEEQQQVQSQAAAAAAAGQTDQEAAEGQGGEDAAMGGGGFEDWHEGEEESRGAASSTMRPGTGQGGLPDSFFGSRQTEGEKGMSVQVGRPFDFLGSFLKSAPAHSQSGKKPPLPVSDSSATLPSSVRSNSRLKQKPNPTASSPNPQQQQTPSFSSSLSAQTTRKKRVSDPSETGKAAQKKIKHEPESKEGVNILGTTAHAQGETNEYYREKARRLNQVRILLTLVRLVRGDAKKFVAAVEKAKQKFARTTRADVDACLKETFESLRKSKEFLQTNQKPSPDFADGLSNYQANIQNACFANAAFQLLAVSDSYRSTALQLLHSPSVTDSPTRAVVLGTLIVGLRESRLRLHAASRIHRTLPQFSNFRRHQDTWTGQLHCSHEFMITVLDLIDKNETAPCIETCDCYKYKSCGWVRESRKTTGVPMIEIPIHTVESEQGSSWILGNGIEEALEQGRGGEWRGEREYDERCRNPDCPFFDGTEKVKNAFCQKITHTPQTVLFYINRTTLQNREGLVVHGGKDTRHIEFGRTLDLGPFLCDRPPSHRCIGGGSSVSSCTEGENDHSEKRERGQEVLHRLVGGIVHLGSGFRSGHFFAFARRTCDVEVPNGEKEGEARVVRLEGEGGEGEEDQSKKPFVVFDDDVLPVAKPWTWLADEEPSLLLYERAPPGYARERGRDGEVEREESGGEGKDAGSEGAVGITDLAELVNDPSVPCRLSDDSLQMQHILVGEEKDRG